MLEKFVACFCWHVVLKFVYLSVVGDFSFLAYFMGVVIEKDGATSCIHGREDKVLRLKAKYEKIAWGFKSNEIRKNFEFFLSQGGGDVVRFHRLI